MISSFWDEEVTHQTLNISPGGCFVRSQLPLEMAEEVVVSFDVQSFGSITTFGRVVRTSLPRRWADRGVAGYGIEFLDLRPLERIVMRSACRMLPPAIPRRTMPRTAYLLAS